MQSINWKGYRFAAWVGQTLLGLAVLAAAVQGKWQNAIALVLFLIVSLVFVVKDDKLPTYLIFYLSSRLYSTPEVGCGDCFTPWTL